MTAMAVKRTGTIYSAKELRFKRIAEKRLQRVLDSIRSLSQCSNKRMYKWEDGQLVKIWNAIDDCNNQWDNGEEGNYWDDYTGSDNNGDGIGDTPYVIYKVVGEDYKDKLPLMNPI